MKPYIESPNPPFYFYECSNSPGKTSHISSVVEESEAWNPNLRSKTAIRISNPRYFTDPSIASASLGIGPNDLLNDFNTFGLLFEALAVRDLRTYADALMGKVAHYRDVTNLECDAIVHQRDGNYGLVEIKIAYRRADGVYVVPLGCLKD